MIFAWIFKIFFEILVSLFNDQCVKIFSFFRCTSFFSLSLCTDLIQLVRAACPIDFLMI